MNIFNFVLLETVPPASIRTICCATLLCVGIYFCPVLLYWPCRKETEEMDQAKIGSFIAARRRQLGLTQAQLAEKLAMTDKAVSKWETGVSHS